MRAAGTRLAEVVLVRRRPGDGEEEREGGEDGEHRSEGILGFEA
jgi:hypothetical protein